MSRLAICVIHPSIRPSAWYAGRLCCPLVIMMKPAEDRGRDDLSADLGDRPRSGDRYPLPQTLMGPSAIEVDLDVLLQNATQLSLVEYDHMVEALPAHRTEEAFADEAAPGVRYGVSSKFRANLLPGYPTALIRGRAFRISRASVTTFSGTKCAYTIVILISECPNRTASFCRLIPF